MKTALWSMLLPVIASAGCKSLPDVCDRYSGVTCIALEIDLSSQGPATIDALSIVARSGFTLAEASSQLSLPNGSAAPFLVPILPLTVSATSGVVEVRALWSGSTVGDATVVTPLQEGAHVRATIQLEAGVGTTSPPDMTSPCTRIANDASTIHSYAVTGSVPAATGGAVSDGVYHAVASKIYGASAPGGTDLGTFRGTLKILGPQFDSVYESMPTQGTATSFGGYGSFTASAAMLNLNFACVSTAMDGMPGYSVTGSGTFDLITWQQGFWAVTSYSL